MTDSPDLRPEAVERVAQELTHPEFFEDMKMYATVEDAAALLRALRARLTEVEQGLRELRDDVERGGPR